jgi:tetratricopeptide (TPR) repeat protein
MKLISRLVFCAFITAAGPNLLACLQGYGSEVRPNAVFRSPAMVESLNDARPRLYWERQKQLQTPRLAAGDFRVHNDYAVTLLHLGEIRPALAILLEIERSRPGQYASASNIGTAYELAGDNEQALRWIRESIVRNRRAHNGTEWLHVKILEAKLAHAADPKWLSTQTVLGLDFGDGPIPNVPKVLPAGNDGKPVSATELEFAIWYQLKERYQFVSAPDPYVASLLFDWANQTVPTGDLETADALYREAIRYGYDRVELVKQRRQGMATVRQLAKPAKR